MRLSRFLKPVLCLMLIAGSTIPAIAQDRKFPVMTLPDNLLSTLKKEHPRLHASAEGFASLKTRIAEDQTLKTWYDNVKAEGDRIIGQEVSIYIIPDGLRLLSTSRRVLDRITTLGFLYQMEGDAKFAERAWKELEAVSKFPDWNPKHFLDVGEMTYAFALGYDWMFSFWNIDQKNIIRSAIIEKGLGRALLAYEGLAVNNDSWWVEAEHNWNQVCHGGIGIGALAIADEQPRLAEYILRQVVKYLPLAMVHFGPDGAWNEGPGYWGYATRYNIGILDALETSLGTDFGLSSIDGFAKTTLFPQYLTGPFNRSFNYADGGEGAAGGSQLFWLASKFNQPLAAQYQKQLVRRGTPFDILWYRADLVNNKVTLPPVGAYYRASEVATMRGAWNDPKTWFVGFKAGDNKANHSNLDLGSFVLDAFGKRFVIDLGADNYNAPGYFSTGANGPRWNYYRMRAEGHNIFVVNPGQKADQDPLAFTKITAFGTKGNNTFAVADLTPAYAAYAKSASRGIALAGGNTVVIRDEVKTAAPSKLYWFLHTKAAINVAGNGRTATLTIDSAKIVAEIVSPSTAKFTVMDAVPLPTSPKAENNKNEGIRKLAINLENSSDYNVVVMLRPVKGKSSAASAFYRPLNEWKLK